MEEVQPQGEATGRARARARPSWEIQQRTSAGAQVQVHFQMRASLTPQHLLAGCAAVIKGGCACDPPGSVAMEAWQLAWQDPVSTVHAKTAVQHKNTTQPQASQALGQSRQRPPNGGGSASERAAGVSVGGGASSTVVGAPPHASCAALRGEGWCAFVHFPRWEGRASGAARHSRTAPHRKPRLHAQALGASAKQKTPRQLVDIGELAVSKHSPSAGAPIQLLGV